LIKTLDKAILDKGEKLAAIAIALIKIKGTYDKTKWSEKKLREYVKDKIMKEIDDVYHTDLELFKAENGNIKIWVFIATQAEEWVVKKWLTEHIKEEGLKVKSFEIEPIDIQRAILPLP